MKNKENKITPEELKNLWKTVDLSEFWKEVVQKVSKSATEYERARAKSMGGLY